MKACLVQLIGLPIQLKMAILVMRYQGVDRQLRRSRQRKKRQQPARQYPSYGPILDQSSF